MVRTKDLLLIVVVLVMLFMAISATLASRMLSKQMNEEALSDATAVEAPAYNVVKEEAQEMDREANIARLRTLLASGDVIESSPSVESSPTVETETVDDSAPGCTAVGTGIEVARNWPLVGVTVKTVGASRVVVHTATVPSLGGTSSLPTTPGGERILLTLPLNPQKTGGPTCMNSEIIGITPTGSLLFNNDIVLYRQAGAETLIGYALDGFPIYGAFTGETDSCGGHDAPGGYRYTVSTQDQTLIECFSGSPQSFNL